MKKSFLALSMVASLLLVGCSDSSSSDSATTTTQSSSSEASSSSASTTLSSEALALSSKDEYSYLVDANGMALYTFDNDAVAVSNCVDTCAVTWPVYGVSVDLSNLPEGIETSMLDSITRVDGSTQVTYNDKPLYYFINDLEAGDINGEGVKDVWHLVKFEKATSKATAIVLGNDGASDYVVTSIDNEDIAGVSQSDPTFNFTVGNTYAISVSNFQSHPLNLNAGNGVVLLAMGANEGSFESDSAVKFSDDGAGTITFTLTQALADSLEVYRCEFHQSMSGSIVYGSNSSESSSSEQSSSSQESSSSVAAVVVSAVVFGNTNSNDYIISSSDSESVAVTGAADPELNLSIGTRYAFSVTNFSGHPFQLSDGDGKALITMGSDFGSFNADTDVNLEDDGEGTITFTLSSNLANALSSYRCQFHATMSGSISIN